MSENRKENDPVNVIKPMVRGCYDLQMLRMQTGLRLAANFRAKLAKHEDKDVDPEEAAQPILDMLRESYRNLTSGIAQRLALPKREGFVGDPIISNYAELVLVHQFIILDREEAAQFRQLGTVLNDIPIYTQWLEKQRGVGPAMAGALISTLDPHKARHPSSFWKYAGMDVVVSECTFCNGAGEYEGKPCINCGGTGMLTKGRSKKEVHLVERTYINKKGEEDTRRGITYEPWLKTKLYVLAASFLRTGGSDGWAQVYRHYKHRLISDQRRTKCTVAQWKKMNDKGQPVDHLWPPGRIDNAAKRYMIKMFLADLWVKWRELEGLPVATSFEGHNVSTYHSAVLGHTHGED
jgi:hypothetical protein